MDRAARGPAVGVAAWRDGRGLERRVRQAAVDAEAARRGAAEIALRALGAAFIALGPRMPVVREAFGSVTPAAAETLGAAAFVAFGLAVLAFRRRGPRSRAYRVLDLVDAFVRDASVLALVFLSGTTSTPLWLFLVPRALDARPASPERLRRGRAILVVTHLGLAAAFAAGGQLVHAVVTGLVLVSVLSCQRVTSRVVGDGLQMRAERDLLQEELDAATLDRTRERIARELHDGVGADVMALLLKLRRGGGASPSAERRVERARSILAELRAVVWMLRPGEGSVGELERLVMARIRDACPNLAVASSTEESERRRPVPSEVALAAAELAPALASGLVAAAGARRVTVGLALAEALELRIAWEGTSLAVGALAAVDGAFADARALVRSRGGALTHVPSGEAGWLCAALPVDRSPARERSS